MQFAFSFGRREQLTAVRDTLRRGMPAIERPVVLSPIAQLVKSLISSRTRDTVSWPVFFRLLEQFQDWQTMAAASVDIVEASLADVTHAKDKAANLLQTLRMISAQHPDFDIGFLADMPMADAFIWLQRHPGVGPKVAASTMNFSTIGRASFVVDSHVLRILKRIGLIGRTATTAAARDRVMEILPDWPADDLVELHVLLKRLGQTICTFHDRRCETCTLLQICARIPD